jgi:hypothetical protein
MVRRLIAFEPRDLWGALGTPCLATLAMVAAVVGARHLLGHGHGPALLLAALATIGAVTYVLALHLLDPKGIGDVRLMLRRGRSQAGRA